MTGNDREATDRDPVDPSVGTFLTVRYTRAVDYARLLHAAQVRKTTAIPYLSHVVATSAIVLEYGGSEDEAIAALLHDAAEDAGGVRRLDHIRAEFGPEVADMVEALSDAMPEDKTDKPPWVERKQRYHAHLRDLDPASGALVVSAADKVHNLQVSRADHRRERADFWSRFNPDAGRVGTLWNYTQLSQVLGSALRSQGGRRSDLADDLAHEVDALVDQVVEIEGLELDVLRRQIDAFSIPSPT